MVLASRLPKYDRLAAGGANGGSDTRRHWAVGRLIVGRSVFDLARIRKVQRSSAVWTREIEARQVQMDTERAGTFELPSPSVRLARRFPKPAPFHSRPFSHKHDKARMTDADPTEHGATRSDQSARSACTFAATLPHTAAGYPSAAESLGARTQPREPQESVR